VSSSRSRPAQAPLLPGQDRVSGRYAVVRVTFHNPDTGYAVLALTPADDPQGSEIAAVGVFGAPAEGAVYEIEGAWRDDPRYGRQVQVSAATPAVPTSLVAIERYLAGASISGLGPVHAKRLVEHFGADTLKVLDEGGQRLQEVRGIGRVRARQIRQSWEQLRGSHTVMVSLQGVAGLTPRQASARPTRWCKSWVRRPGRWFRRIPMPWPRSSAALDSRRATAFPMSWALRPTRPFACRRHCSTRCAKS